MTMPGFIGLGIMGRSMAHNLLRAGHPLRVWNRTPERMAPLLEAGASAGRNPADIAAQCDVIFICVSDTPDVVAVTLGDDGLIHSLQPGTVIVDHSTISPQTTQELGQRVAALGATWLDAPISGGSEGAARGTLSIMLGGEAAAVAQVRPYLQVMGQTITHVGPLGAGQMAKLVNQILIVNTMQGIAEALLLAQAGELSLEKTLEAVSGGAAGSWMLTNRAPQVMRRDWRPGFMVDLQTKDLRLALEAADQLGVPLPHTGQIFQAYRALQAQGLGAEGNHALVKALEKLAGRAIGAPSPEKETHA